MISIHASVLKPPPRGGGRSYRSPPLQSSPHCSTWRRRCPHTRNMYCLIRFAKENNGGVKNRNFEAAGERGRNSNGRITSTPWGAETAATKVSTQVSNLGVFGAHFHISLPQPPRQIPPPRTPRGMIICRAPWFQCKEAKVAAWAGIRHAAVMEDSRDAVGATDRSGGSGNKLRGNEAECEGEDWAGRRKPRGRRVIFRTSILVLPA